MLAIFLIAVVLLQLLVQVALNLWNRHFFDALESGRMPLLFGCRR